MDAHSHPHPSSELTPGAATWAIAIGLVVVVIIGEALTAAWSGSIALASDAIHLATDVGTLVLTAYAVSAAHRPATARHTYGYHRTGILVATVNACVLILIAVGVAVISVGRLAHPHPVSALPVIVMAIVALVVNGVIAQRLLQHGHNLGVRSAAWHALSDAAGSAAVIVGALATWLTQFSGFDAIASLVISCLIAASALVLLREATSILLEESPRLIPTEAVRDALLHTNGISDVHDLHVWSLDATHHALSAHVEVGDLPLATVTSILQTAQLDLCTHFGIDHITLQPESSRCSDDVSLFCDLDGGHLHRHPAHSSSVPDAKAPRSSPHR